MSNSKHAQERIQQRGIPPLIVQWLEAFGEEQHDRHGAVILHFSKRARRRLEHAVGREPVRRLGDWLNSYAVFANGVLITVGMRWKKMQH